jgi:GT2 family glycosyltransferase
VKLSIIILNYNVRYFLEQCLQSVAAAAKNISHEIIMVDNNSSDTSCAMVSEIFPDVQLISNTENIGFSKANNQGVNQAKGEFVLILNPDTLLAEDTLDLVLAFAEKQKNLGALGIHMINGAGQFLPESKRNVPTVKVANQKLRGITKNYYAIQLDEKEIAKVSILTGAFLLMKRQVYQDIGGFDEDYFMYGEDVDLSYKLLKKGYDNFYYGDTTIVHYKGESTKKDISYLKNFYGAMQLFYEKHFQINWFFKTISKIGFKSIILYKSLQGEERNQELIKSGKIIYIGNNVETFERLKKVTNVAIFEMHSTIPGNTDFYQIIFDADFLSAKQIIQDFQKKELEAVSKRIIPRNCNFYLGSDSSIGKGEVVDF